MAVQTLVLPTTKYLQECFVYDQATGVLRWKTRPRDHFPSDKEWKRWNVRFAGTAAGRKQKQHCRIHLVGHVYAAHRVVWKLVTGMEPPANIDHKNCDGFDNRWDNLREADQTKQNWNKGLAKNNTSGYRGVYRNRNKWCVFIKINGVQRTIGRFSTSEEAAIVYAAAARRLYGEFYHEPDGAGAAAEHVEEDTV